MNEKELEFHRDRCKRLLNGEKYETYYFAPAEIQNFLSLIERLQQENKELHKKLKATEKGLNKVLSKRKKWKDRYYKEKRKNKQLEQMRFVFNFFKGLDLKTLNNIKNILNEGVDG